ncbi:hypothetical protein Pla175_42060 [Pirellulimonas nuda]|uniref:Uncharacterized protein n=2 Tax=Pirellulimonas nuda TaxID=2528009 RepID=A0A518DH44_9BACT|nr:hypothetical protein Pla175_42060 [Pirellulimonas nuda]
MDSRGWCSVVVLTTLLQTPSIDCVAQVVFDNGMANEIQVSDGMMFPAGIVVRDSVDLSPTTVFVNSLPIGGGPSPGRSVAVYGSSLFRHGFGQISGDLFATDDSTISLIFGSSVEGEALITGSALLQVGLSAGARKVTLNENARAEFTNSGPGVIEIAGNATASFNGGAMGNLTVTENGFAEILYADNNPTNPVSVVSGNATLIARNGLLSKILVQDNARFSTGFAGFDLVTVRDRGLAVVNFGAGAFGDLVATDGGTILLERYRTDFFSRLATLARGGKITLDVTRTYPTEAASILAESGSFVDLVRLRARGLTIDASDSFVNLSGGDLDELSITAKLGSEVSIRGGIFRDANLLIETGSVVTFFGSGFLVEGLGPPGEFPMAGSVSGWLADGQAFAFDFTRQVSPGADAGLIRFVTVPEPAAWVLSVAGAFAGVAGLRRRLLR